SLLGADEPLVREEAPHVVPEIAASSAVMELSDPPPAVELRSVEPAVGAPVEGGEVPPAELSRNEPLLVESTEPSLSEPSLAGELASALVAELTAAPESDAAPESGVSAVANETPASPAVAPRDTLPAAAPEEDALPDALAAPEAAPSVTPVPPLHP